jgi:small subunit ribosomal protein S20
MPLRHESQVKSVRQSKKRRIRNISQKSETRTAVKKAVLALGTDSAEVDVGCAVKKLDKLEAHGILHKNTVARRKSRLIKKYNKSLVAN